MSHHRFYSFDLSTPQAMSLPLAVALFIAKCSLLYLVFCCLVAQTPCGLSKSTNHLYRRLKSERNKRKKMGRKKLDQGDWKLICHFHNVRFLGTEGTHNLLSSKKHQMMPSFAYSHLCKCTVQADITRGLKQKKS